MSRINAIKERLTDFLIVQVDHFAKVRNDIDIRRETLVESYEKCNLVNYVYLSKKDLKEIQRQSVEMIKQIDTMEEAFQNNYIKNLRPELDAILDGDDTIKQEKLARLFPLLDFDLRRNKFKTSLCDTKSLGKLKVYKPFFTNVNDLLDHDELQNIVVCSNDKFKIEILNMNIGCKIRQLMGHTNDIECVICFGEDKLISCSRDETIRVWSLLNKGECLSTLRGHTNSVKCVKLLKNGHLASGSVDRLIKIWNLK
jgi:WD40 repeat protein